jgi:hypothetical protein
MRNRSIRRSLLFGAIMLAAAGPSASAWAAPDTAAAITATPNNLMVNTKTTLTGRHFPPVTTLRLVECSRTTWVVVAQHPCDTNNTVTVTTSDTGHFTTPFKAELCPRATRVGPTAVRCYIGVPTPSGKDTVTLRAAVPITVTYP